MSESPKPNYFKHRSGSPRGTLFDPTIPDSNLTAVLTGFEEIVLEERPVPVPAHDEILVKVMATGICGTDLNFYRARGMRPLTKPHVLGHESSGEVLAVGPAVKHVKPGDHVAIEPALPCRVCRYCKRGQWNYCVNDGYMATPPTDGTMSRLYVCPEHNAVALPPSISWAESGCIQPLAVAVQVARRAGPLAHQSVCVVGCGPLGLLTLALARAHGAKCLMAVDINEARVAFAKTYAGTEHGYVMPAPPTSDSAHGDPDHEAALLAWAGAFAAQVRADVGEGHGIDVVVEASGAESAILAAMTLLRHGGTYIQAGMGRPLTLFPTFALADKELNIKGSLRYTAGCFEDAIDLIAKGIVDVAGLITSQVPLSRVEDAFSAFANKGEIKVVIMNQE